MRNFSRALRVSVAAVATTALTTGLVAPAHAAASGPKNIIYMIGDGMGYGHIASNNLYESGQSKYLVEGAFGADTAKELEGESVQAFEDFNRLSMTTFPHGGSYDPAKAWSDHEYIKQGPTDSAAAGTAMATGSKVDNGPLGVSAYGHEMENLSERAIREGKSAGVVTSVPFDHATPASFAAHNKNRNNYLEIGESMINSDLSVIMGAGHPEYNDDAQKVAAGSEDYSYISKENLAALRDGSKGWEFTDNTAGFEDWAAGNVEDGKKYFGLAPAATTLQQNRSGDAEAKEPGTDAKNDIVDLKTMTTGALNALGKDEDGFSLMVEGGAIDWSGHANQTGRDIEEVQDFNAAVDAAINWVEKNSSWEETLLIVTADHETGYLSGADETDAWKAQTGTKGTAPTHEWYLKNHTNQVVPFFFKGAGSEDIQAKVSGTDPVRGEYIDNTTVAKLALDEWWFNTSEDDTDNPGDTDNKPSNGGSSNGSSSAGAGLAGASVMALIFGIITAAAQALGLVKFDFKALQDLIKRFA